MNITFVASYLTVFGGGGVFLTNYANKLCEKGHSITVVSQKVDKKLYKFNITNKSLNKQRLLIINKKQLKCTL